jgi:hypothetical protein
VRRLYLEYRWRRAKIAQTVTMWLAWHMPRYLRMWVVVRAFADATTTSDATETPDEVGYSKVMRRAFPNA